MRGMSGEPIEQFTTPDSRLAPSDSHELLDAQRGFEMAQNERLKVERGAATLIARLAGRNHCKRLQIPPVVVLGSRGAAINAGVLCNRPEQPGSYRFGHGGNDAASGVIYSPGAVGRAVGRAALSARSDNPAAKGAPVQFCFMFGHSGDLFHGTASALGVGALHGAQKVRKALNGQYARVRRHALRNFRHRVVRDAGMLGNVLVRPLGFDQAALDVREEGFVIGSHGSQNSHLWTCAQWPHVDYPIVDTLRMGTARDLAARSLTRLMNSSSLDTLQKVADKSGVGYGTIRRVKTADVSVTLDNLESIAAAFDLSVIEFLEDDRATPVERLCRSVAHMLAHLPEDERMQIVNYVTLRSELHAVGQAAGSARQQPHSGDPRSKRRDTK